MDGYTALLTCTPQILGSCPSRSLGNGSSKVQRRRVARRIQIKCSYGSRSGRKDDDAMGGDAGVQQMLVEMVQIQLGKTRVKDFVDERSEYMRGIANEAQREYNRIASRTMKGLDASGSRVLRQLDQDACAIERELKKARAELEVQQKEFEEYQLRSNYSRNEGLFFKNLYAAPVSLRNRSALYKEKVTVVLARPSRNFSSSYKQILYAGLSLVIVSFIWSSSTAVVAGTMMRPTKLAAYGVIFSILMTQLVHVKKITGESEEISSVTDKSADLATKEVSNMREPQLKEGSSTSDLHD